MKDYEDLNIFDLASILQRMLFDENIRFSLNFNDREFEFYKVEVAAATITLFVSRNEIELMNKVKSYDELNA